MISEILDAMSESHSAFMEALASHGALSDAQLKTLWVEVLYSDVPTIPSVSDYIRKAYIERGLPYIQTKEEKAIRRSKLDQQYAEAYDAAEADMRKATLQTWYDNLSSDTKYLIKLHDIHVKHVQRYENKLVNHMFRYSWGKCAKPLNKIMRNETISRPDLLETYYCIYSNSPINEKFATKRIKDAHNMFSRAIVRAPHIDRDVVVYRGSDIIPSIGSVVTLPHISSVTSILGIAETFGKIYKINVPAGHPMLWIDKYNSDYFRFDEGLLPSGTRLFVESDSTMNVLPWTTHVS